ncbi:signal recognition particle-docking protein FtsY [Endozoicomonas sp.]|uniref:signal recognition particle-docking protein FtsY n=1 Tax=Endozoicomonas sp. TaxID=1892382 RepID=UPI003AF56C4A
MFGSRKDDEKKAKRSFWPWGRRTQNDVSEEQVEPKAEPAVEDVVSTVETPEVTPESASESSTNVVDVVPEIAQHAEDKPVHHETLDEPTHKAPEASDEEAPVATAAAEIAQAAEPEIQPEKAPVELESKPEAKGGFFARMRQGLSKTRNVLVEGVAELFIGKKEIDDDLLDELETQLLVADVGVEATTEIIEKLTQKVKYKELDDADALMAALQSELADILEPADQPLVIPEQDTPFVILVVGVNGVGKTTTIGKLARKFQSEGRKVMLAAGDTFRAAAVEQLQVWGERNEIPVVAQHTGADSASVIFDAFEAARARNIDVLIADTAGRLHNKDHLMEELKKVKRVLGKLDPNAPHEVLLVLDAGTGQNALSQARLFHEAVQLTGMALTKLDGTAKGGVIFALSKQMKLPIRFLGVGEQIDDLRPFSGKEFVKALFSREG